MVGGEAFEIVEGLRPAAIVVVARFFVEEELVFQGEGRSRAIGAEEERHLRFPLRRRRPCP